MKFGDAINVHRGWKIKLATYIHKPDGSLKADVACCDDKCDMGQWIHGSEARQFSSLEEFITMKAEHARFHREAGRIIREIDSGKSIDEEAVLGAQSEFGKTAAAVVSAIMALKKKMPS